MIGTVSINGRFRARSGEEPMALTAEQHVGLRVLKQAVDDLKILCGYGLITRTGKCNKWPKVMRVKVRGEKHGDYICIAGLRDPHSHEKLCAWFLTKDNGQLWCDLIGWKMPCADIFWTIVRKWGAPR
jgi:hypothetical protein